VQPLEVGGDHSEIGCRLGRSAVDDLHHDQGANPDPTISCRHQLRYAKPAVGEERKQIELPVKILS
jgi:hypothetical protein